jgi:hypothetical protein
MLRNERGDAIRPAVSRAFDIKPLARPDHGHENENHEKPLAAAQRRLDRFEGFASAPA